MQSRFIRQNTGHLNNDSYWWYLPQHSSRGQKGHGACHLYKAQEVLLLSASSPSPTPHSCSWAECSREFFHGPLTCLCIPGYEHSKPLPRGELANQQMYWVALRPQPALHPVSSSDVVGACEIVKRQSNHHHSFPEYSSRVPQSVTQEAPEPKWVSL